MCEDHSRPGQQSRWFSAWDELAPALGALDHGLAVWSENFGIYPEAEDIQFSLETQKKLGERGRTILRSPAFIRIIQNNEQQGCLASTYLACWNEKGARQRSMSPVEVLDRVNWKNVAATAATIARRIKKESPAKLRSYPIMPDAWRRLKAGEIKLWDWGTECSFPSPLISE